MNENKIQKNKIRNMDRMLIIGAKPIAMTKTIFLKTIPDFLRQVKNSETRRKNNDDLH